MQTDIFCPRKHKYYASRELHTNHCLSKFTYDCETCLVKHPVCMYSENCSYCDVSICENTRASNKEYFCNCSVEHLSEDLCRKCAIQNDNMSYCFICRAFHCASPKDLVASRTDQASDFYYSNRKRCLVCCSQNTYSEMKLICSMKECTSLGEPFQVCRAHHSWESCKKTLQKTSTYRLLKKCEQCEQFICHSHGNFCHLCQSYKCNTCLPRDTYTTIATRWKDHSCLHCNSCTSSRYSLLYSYISLTDLVNLILDY